MLLSDRQSEHIGLWITQPPENGFLPTNTIDVPVFIIDRIPENNAKDKFL